MQVFLLEPDSLKVLIGLPLHLLPNRLISVVLSHFLVSILSVLFVRNVFCFLSHVLLVVNLYYQLRLVLSVTTGLIGILQDLHIWGVTRSTVSVIFRL